MSALQWNWKAVLLLYCKLLMSICACIEIESDNIFGSVIKISQKYRLKWLT